MKGALMHLHPGENVFCSISSRPAGPGYSTGGGWTVSKQWEGVNEFSKTFAGASSNSRSFGAEGHAKGAGKIVRVTDRHL